MLHGQRHAWPETESGWQQRPTIQFATYSKHKVSEPIRKWSQLKLVNSSSSVLIWETEKGFCYQIRSRFEELVWIHSNISKGSWLLRSVKLRLNQKEVLHNKRLPQWANVDSLHAMYCKCFIELYCPMYNAFSRLNLISGAIGCNNKLIFLGINWLTS